MSEDVFQIQAIYAVLKERMPKCKGITSKEAFEEFGATRLSGIIFELRKRLKETEYDIVSVWRHGINRYGRNTRYVEYVLVKK